MLKSKTREITFIYAEEIDEDKHLLSTSYKNRTVAYIILTTALKLRDKKKDVKLELDGIYRMSNFWTLTHFHSKIYRID